MVVLCLSGVVEAADTFTVAPSMVADPKAVFATVESANVVPARTRIGGTVVELAVGDGDKVAAGETIATVADEKLSLQIRSLDAEIAGLQAQLDQAEIDLSRVRDLVDRGTVPRSRLDQAETAVDVAKRALESRSAARSVVEQQVAEGAVLAPAAGRVLEVPVTVGTVVGSGEPIAEIAEENYVLRLRVPERHARYLEPGDAVRLDPADPEAATGRITLVYPRIEDGRVIADAEVPDLGDYFVGERVRVWVSSTDRETFVVPAEFVTTRFGVDFVRLESDDGAIEVPVQRGEPRSTPDVADAVEILSGVKAGDVLVHP